MRYLDSLVVDELISDCMPRINAWNSDLVKKVMKKDRIAPGVFGKLQVSFIFINLVSLNYMFCFFLCEVFWLFVFLLML